VLLLLPSLQILLQVQQMSSLPQSEQYKGLWDALRRIPLREGGLQVKNSNSNSSSSSSRRLWVWWLVHVVSTIILLPAAR
jgi:hypothetical protein